MTKLTSQLKEEKEVLQQCVSVGVYDVWFHSQLNKCLSENQKLWKDRVTVLEEKFDVTMKQKEKV